MKDFIIQFSLQQIPEGTEDIILESVEDVLIDFSRLHGLGFEWLDVEEF